MGSGQGAALSRTFDSLQSEVFTSRGSCSEPLGFCSWTLTLPFVSTNKLAKSGNLC